MAAPERVFTTKALRVLERPSGDGAGRGIFEFLDSYSVFHYGRMPDPIPGKGRAVCDMATFTLTRLRELGMPTHLRERVTATALGVDLYRIPRTPVPPGTTSVFIPLQVVYRNLLPPGASIFHRLARGQLTPAELGLDAVPAPGTQLDTPIVEFTTKLEPVDRFIGEPEAAAVAGIDATMLRRVKEFTLEVNKEVTRHAEACGLRHADGKVEFALDARGELVLVDVAGTADENRFLRDDKILGKQILRDYYERSGFEERFAAWLAEGSPEATRPIPEPLPKDLIGAVSDIYAGLADLWVGEGAEAHRRLDTAIAEAASWLGPDEEGDRGAS